MTLVSYDCYFVLLNSTFSGIFVRVDYGQQALSQNVKYVFTCVFLTTSDSDSSIAGKRFLRFYNNGKLYRLLETVKAVATT